MIVGNHFLDSLADDDRSAVMDLLTLGSVAAGEILVEQGEPVTTVHFPTTACLANIILTPGGRAVQTATIGREGLSGLAPFMAAVDCGWQISCEVGGAAFSCPAGPLRDLADQRPGLMRRLLVLTHFYQAQANQMAVCSALHLVEPRLARWLLTTCDVVGRERLVINQEQIAARMGVQRTSVVTAFGELKRERLVRHGRGWLEIRDREGMKRRACSCYALMRKLGEEIEVLPPLDGDTTEKGRSPAAPPPMLSDFG